MAELDDKLQLSFSHDDTVTLKVVAIISQTNTKIQNHCPAVLSPNQFSRKGLPPLSLRISQKYVFAANRNEDSLD